MIFYPVGYGLALALGRLASPFVPKLREGLDARRDLAVRVGGKTLGWRERPFWFHVASSGELEQALPIMERLKFQAPHVPIFLTYFSPSGARGLKLETERRARAGAPVPWDAADYSPYDFPWSVSSFLKALRPRAFIAINRELWPGILGGCRRADVPTYLFASYFSPHSRRWIWLYRKNLTRFTHIGTTEATTAKFLSPLAGNVTIDGDPRVERVLARKNLARDDFRWGGHFEGKKTFILASVWPQDWAVIHEPLERLAAKFPDWRFVFVPHEPGDEFIHWAGARRWSEWSESPDVTSDLIVDKVGLLAELYRVGSLVFVGGSFKARVHNVLEPAAYRLPVITGPLIENSGEAMEMSRDSLSRVVDGASFYREAERLMGDHAYRAGRAERAHRYLIERQGAAARYVSRLLDLN